MADVVNVVSTESAINIAVSTTGLTPGQTYYIVLQVGSTPDTSNLEIVGEIIVPTFGGNGTIDVTISLPKGAYTLGETGQGDVYVVDSLGSFVAGGTTNSSLTGTVDFSV